MYKNISKNILAGAALTALLTLGITGATAAPYGKTEYSSKGQDGDSLYGLLMSSSDNSAQVERETQKNEDYADGTYLNNAEIKALDNARKLRVMSPYQLAMAAAAQDAAMALNKMEKINNAAKMPELSERKVRHSVWQANTVPDGLGRIIKVDKMMTITEFTRFIARIVKHEGYRVVYPRRIVPDPLIDLRQTRGRIIDVLRIAGNQMGDRLDVLITPKKRGHNHGVIELIANGETNAEGYSLIGE